MKTKLFRFTASLLIFTVIGILSVFSQGVRSLDKKYLTALPSFKPDNSLRRYRMTAIYINRDLYGKFLNKTKVTGEYTRGLENGYSSWNNVYISASGNYAEPFPEGKKQDYIENMKYIPSDKMLEKGAFKGFPATPESVLARNLIWDMFTFDTYGWKFEDSLKINEPYEINGQIGEFDMGEIGKYNHNKIIIIWKGISVVNGNVCSVIDFNAIDNSLEINLEQVNAKGTEQYWGTCWISLKTKSLEKGYMYGGTILEAGAPGFNNKFLIKTIRELWVEPLD